MLSMGFAAADSPSTGIPLIGELAWGSRFCQFYRTTDDLLDILIPYVKAGLDNNECCMLVVEDPEDTPFKDILHQLDTTETTGQLEVIAYEQWQAAGQASAVPVVPFLDRAILKGFSGIRLVFNVSPRAAALYDLSRYRVLALYIYPRDKYDALTLMEVMKDHRCALVRNGESWELMESSEAHTVRDELKRNEERLQSLFANMSEGFAYLRLVLDPEQNPRDYVFLEVNAAFTQLTGLGTAQVLRKKATEVFPELRSDPAEWMLKFAEVAQTQQPACFESYVPSIGRWFSFSAFSTQTGFLAVTFTDITARKQAEEKLIQLNRTHRALGNCSKLLMNATDEQSFMQEVCRIVTQNCGHALVWIGFARNDRQQRVQPVAHAGFDDGYLDSINISWADNERGRGPTGTAIRTARVCSCPNMLADPAFAPWREQALARGYASSIALPLISEGRAFGAITIYSGEPDPFSDDEVTLLEELANQLAQGIAGIRLRAENTRAEAALRASAERFRLLSFTSAQLLAAQDPQQIVESLCHKVMEHLDCQTFFNFLVDEQAGKLHLNACAGVPDEEIKDIEWLDFGVAVCGCVARDGCRIVAENIPSASDPRTELVASYGIKAYACHPLQAEGGKLIGTLSFGTKTREVFSDDDLSLMKAIADQVAVAMERLRNEQALRASEEELRESARTLELRVKERTAQLEALNLELEGIAYSLSHDLRTPLRAIDGFNYLLLEEYREQLDDKAREYIDRARDGAQKAWQQMDAVLNLLKLARTDITSKEVDLSAIVLAIVSQYRSAHPGEKIRFRVQEDVRGVGNETLLIIILQNLIDNAVKFTGKKTDRVVEFGSRFIDGRPVYFVKDNGAGFNMQYSQKLFTIFQRLHVKEFEGIGIGLASVRHFVLKHGGQVWAEGEEGKGATFYFTLG